MDYSMSAADKAYSQQKPADMPSVGSATPFRIRRPGARPLVFRGTELAMAMSYTPEIPYWYELNIVRTEDQRFALMIRKFYQSEDEMDCGNAWMFDTLPEVFDAIEGYDAAQDVRIDLPDVSHMSAAEMAAMAMDMRARVGAARTHFASVVGELLSQIDEAMAA